MDAILNPRNGASITNTIGVTASGIHPFQENEQPNDFNDIFVPQTSFSIAEPTEFQMGELGIILLRCIISLVLFVVKKCSALNQSSIMLMKTF